MTTLSCGLVVDGSAALTDDDPVISVVPLRIMIGGEEYVDDGHTDAYAGFYARLRAGEVPTTSTPAPGEYLERFRGVTADAIVCLTIPARWSGMYAAASLAADMLAEAEGRRRVTVVETETAIASLALVARVAAELCRDGAGAAAVIERVNTACRHVRMYGALATLTYVARSGRVNALVAGISNSLHVRPVFRLHGGETGRVALTRTTSGALDALERVAREQLDGRPQRILVFHADAPQEAAALSARVSAASRVAKTETVALSPIAGSYTGPGAFGFAALPLPS
jgi:DegV family protein with EDD domain